MNDHLNHWDLLRKLTWYDVLVVLAVLILARLLVLFMRWILSHVAEKAPPHLRLTILRASPIIRLLIDIGAVVVIMPILVEPTFRNIVAFVAGIGLALAFALKDYVSSLVAGVVTVLENTYQPGDWIEVDGTYGEVKSIGVRAVHIVTPDDTEVIVPLKAYVKESREQFLLITDLMIRGKEALRRINVRFAQAPYAATEKG